MPTSRYPITATDLTPILSLRMPHTGHATRATSSSAKPSVPTASPTPFCCPIRSVTTKLIELFKKTRKEMLKSAMKQRYVATCTRVAVKEGKAKNAITALQVTSVSLGAVEVGACDFVVTMVQLGFVARVGVLRAVASVGVLSSTSTGQLRWIALQVGRTSHNTRIIVLSIPRAFRLSLA